MSGFWGRIFGAPEVISKTTDAIIATGDKLFYTDEEKAEARMKMLEWTLRFHEASKGSNVARRWIAIMVVAMFLALVAINAGLILIGAENMAAAMFELNSETLVVPVATIMAFYFTSGIIRDFTATKQAR